MRKFWNTAAVNADPKPLTRADLERAFEAVMKPPPPHRHLTSLRAKERVMREGGCLRCVECGAVICADG